MPDQDSQLAQGTVDFRNEERRAANAGPETLPTPRSMTRDEYKTLRNHGYAGVNADGTYWMMINDRGATVLVPSVRISG